ncbi:MAG: cell filamentation protein Fic [Denitrovibrio sp.]|nr:MAG: cell filamentation protein Fic [Denitrovibrio sp.]
MDKSKRIGRYLKGSLIGGKPYNAYVPNPLPPEPSIDLRELYPLLDKASVALGRLDGMSTILPDTTLFLYMYVRKEAVLSSQIEGTQSSLSDLLIYENEAVPGAPIDDVTEVSSYVAAMYYGLEMLKSFPMSLRLIKEIHEKLMTNSRGGTKQPGEFRKTQNWVGGKHPSVSKFVPPPPEKLMECLDSFEKYLHDEKDVMPVLVKAAIAHVQFETIHPFLDGNGRLGRLLITFILCIEGLLKQPLLYLSLYFKTHRQEYYEHLQNVRESGDWESWIKFFIEGVVETSNQATETARNILQLFDKDRKLIEESGKSNATVLAIHNYMQTHPLVSTTKLKEACNTSLPTVIRNLATLESLGIVKETTGKERHKVFAYIEYISILSEGTEPI